MKTRKKNYEYSRENIRMRLYIRGKEEIYEIYSEYEGKTLLEYQQAFPIGEPATDFIYGDFRDIYSEMTKSTHDNILSFAEYATSRHPYFCFLKQAVYDPTAKIPELIKAYETIRNDFSHLISGCWSSNTDKKISRPQKYIEDRSQLSHANTLNYGKIISEYNATEGFWALPDETAPYPIVPPVERLAHGNRPMTLFEILYPETPYDMLRFLTAQYLNSDLSFRKCKSCDRFFAITGNSKAEYCTRPSADSDKTCRQMGAMRLYEKKKNQNPINRAFTKAYKTHNARIRYGTMTREEFAEWSVNARKQRDRCLAGKVTLTEFEEWLNE